ncbi:MAG: hypothetical protein R6X22_04185 [Gemmatimonadota bacterium]
MLRLTLERRPGRDDLVAFGLAARSPAAWVLPALGLLPAAGAALRPSALARPWRMWNRAARGYGRVARAAVLGVAFGVFTVVGRAGARFALHPSPSGPGWTPKARDAAGRDAAPGATGASWARRLLSWSRDGENGWAAFLVPFLLLLHALEADASARAAEEIYTLY